MSYEARVLKKLREICLALPEAAEVTAWGHPDFKAGKKTFAAFEHYKGKWVICFKTDLLFQRHLVDADERFFVSPYWGKHGWVSLQVDARLDWGEVRALVSESYRLVATKKMIDALDRSPPRGSKRPRKVAE